MTSQLETYKNFTVLYVEDENSIRNSVEQCLKFIFNVITAKDGQDGLEKFNQENIDMIITDINMPIKNGIRMMEEIREIAPDVPFIVTSAFESEFMSQAEELGTHKYLLKPFDMKDLVISTMDALK